ncbi:MAG: chorismate synthase [Sphingobacteriales bacterium]|jgi:chorismate synthase
MAGNVFGRNFRISTFGESHGPAIGVVIDGCPPMVDVSADTIDAFLALRKPGQSKITTQRKENDTVEILSGVFEGKATGTPIALLIRNGDQRSKDYDHIKDSFRPSHADFTYHKKYGHRDYRGGGRSSARETAARVAAGSVALEFLKNEGIEVLAYVSQVHHIKLDKSYQELDLSKRYENIIRCPEEKIANEMIDFIDGIRKDGDTVGGIITCVIKGCKPGLGNPVFNKLHADLGQAILGINAVKGFEIGEGFNCINFKGSTHNDAFYQEGDVVKTRTNHSGGVQGGISNGEDIYFNVAFKPVATIMIDQESVDKSGDSVMVKGKGRHDPCVLPRAVPIVEAMAALVIADNYLDSI